MTLVFPPPSTARAARLHFRYNRAMRIAVYGSGAVGGYFGARLAQTGQEVIFIARGEHLQAMQTSGLRIDSLNGDLHLEQVRASDDPRRVGEVDFILVGVKAWQVPEAALAMRPLVGQDTLVIPLQNGVDAPAQLAAALGSQHATGGLCQISVYRAAPGYLRHVGIEPRIVFGDLNNRPSQRLEDLRQAFEQAAVTASVPDDIHAALWRKFLFIAAVSGVGAVTRLPVGAIRSIPETRQMLEQALRETYAVARRRKIALDEGIVAATLSAIDGIAPDVIPSMQRDIQEGHPSELGSQNGAVVRMGLESGIPTPTHAFIYASLLPQELIARRDLLDTPAINYP